MKLASGVLPPILPPAQRVGYRARACTRKIAMARQSLAAANNACVAPPDCSGDFLPPSPPGEKAPTSRDDTGQPYAYHRPRNSTGIRSSNANRTYCSSINEQSHEVPVEIRRKRLARRGLHGKCEFVAWGYPVGDTYVTRRRGGAFNPEKEAAEESHNWTRGHLGNGPREPRTADVCQIEGNCIRPGCRAQCQPRRRSKVDGKGVRRPHTRHGYRAATRWTPAINTEVVLIDHECVGVSGDRYSHAVQ